MGYQYQLADKDKEIGRDSVIEKRGHVIKFTLAELVSTEYAGLAGLAVGQGRDAQPGRAQRQDVQAAAELRFWLALALSAGRDMSTGSAGA